MQKFHVDVEVEVEDKVLKSSNCAKQPRGCRAEEEKVRKSGKDGLKMKE